MTAKVTKCDVTSRVLVVHDGAPKRMVFKGEPSHFKLHTHYFVTLDVCFIDVLHTQHSVQPV